MQNRALHDALHEFALEAAAVLTEDQRAGGELGFDVAEEGSRLGPALYRYRPLTGRFIAERWDRLSELPACIQAGEALGAGAAQYLRMNGLRGEQAQPALQAMLERLYEDATTFAFPEERFERVYADVEATLYRDAVAATVVAPIRGLHLEGGRVELGDGLSLVPPGGIDAPPEAVWPDDDEPCTLCVLERHVAPDDPMPAEEARERFPRLIEGLRLYKAGGIALGAIGWRRAAEGRWMPVELEGSEGRGVPMTLIAGDAAELREFLEAVETASPGGTVSCALSRFHMGCSRALESEALSDYLLALRALLDATSDTGRASLGLRLAALCAEEGRRRALQRRVELTISLERFLMRGGRDGDLDKAIAGESPLALVEEMERHLRALLRDVLCGYLDPDLKSVADDMLLEAPEGMDIKARDTRSEPATDEIDAVQPELQPEPEPETEPEPEPETAEPEGVTPSADWAHFDEDPESYSAPV